MIAGKLVDTDSSINTLSVIASGKDVDLEETFNCDSSQHASGGTRIRRYVNAVVLDFSFQLHIHACH